LATITVRVALIRGVTLLVNRKQAGQRTMIKAVLAGVVNASSVTAPSVISFVS
jgi:hypothetical protein